MAHATPVPPITPEDRSQAGDAAGRHLDNLSGKGGAR